MTGHCRNAIIADNSGRPVIGSRERSTKEMKYYDSDLQKLQQEVMEKERVEVKLKDLPDFATL